MNATCRFTVVALVVVALVLSTGEAVRGFKTLGSTWPNGTIVMHLQMGSGSGTLIDGTTSWNQVMTNALATWNTHLNLAQFSAVQNSTVAKRDGDLVNNVFFDSMIHGRAFGDDTLAVATRWTRGTTERVEGDVVFNTTFPFNSYRGALRSSGGAALFDILRVALHEFGHVLGLDHPDENGQSVSALMNSLLGNLDALTADDIAGAMSLYGGGITSNISFPPRNEPNDFFNQLIGVYRDELRAAESTIFVDPEGIVVWLIEYARYRVGLCDHATASSRVFLIIDGGGTLGVCALTPLGAIPFPPRDQGLVFMLALDDKYRDGLGRPAGASFVDKEGAVVWVLEYLRYRLNGCGHGDAVSKVFGQIRGMGIAPVCSA